MRAVLQAAANGSLPLYRSDGSPLELSPADRDWLFHRARVAERQNDFRWYWEGTWLVLDRQHPCRLISAPGPGPPRSLRAALRPGAAPKQLGAGWPRRGRDEGTGTASWPSARPVLRPAKLVFGPFGMSRRCRAPASRGSSVQSASGAVCTCRSGIESRAGVAIGSTMPRAICVARRPAQTVTREAWLQRQVD
jgi:hypothetical protein